LKKRFTTDRHENAGNSIPRLPLFWLTGGTEKERKVCVEQLTAVLVRRSLNCIFFDRKAYQKQHPYAVQSLVKQYDLVVIDAGTEAPHQQICLGSTGTSAGDCIFWRGSDDWAIAEFADLLIERMDDLVRQTPVWGCILIGGKSSRMGRPKHLIEDESKITWLERTTDILRPLVDGLVVSGNGMLPGKLTDTVRLADIPGVAGPLTGILAACRWQPMVSWLLVACDMPHITSGAIQWLLSGRRAGCWGRVPRLPENKHCEPLLAWYDFRAAQLFEQQFYEGNLRIGGVASHPKIDNPVIPDLLRHGWQNINTPDQLLELE